MTIKFFYSKEQKKLKTSEYKFLFLSTIALCEALYYLSGVSADSSLFIYFLSTSVSPLTNLFFASILFSIYFLHKKTITTLGFKDYDTLFEKINKAKETAKKNVNHKKNPWYFFTSLIVLNKKMQTSVTMLIIFTLTTFIRIVIGSQFALLETLCGIVGIGCLLMALIRGTQGLMEIL